MNIDPGQLHTYRSLLSVRRNQTTCALFNLLDRKGIINKEEPLEENKIIHASMLKTET